MQRPPGGPDHAVPVLRPPRKPGEGQPAFRGGRVHPPSAHTARNAAGRFTTFERVQLRELTIIKRSGRRAPFDREKLVRSISVAIRKRPVDPERVERWSTASCASWRTWARPRSRPRVVGEMVMKALKSLDDVAYVRYASVYRDFRQTDDFASFLSAEGLAEEPA